MKFKILLFMAALLIQIGCEMPRNNPYDPGAVANTGDLTPPSVESITPPDGSSGFKPDASVNIRFSETMDRESVQSRFSLTGEYEVSGQLSWGETGQVFIFSPDIPLRYYGSYTLNLEAGAADPSGNILLSTVHSEFEIEGLIGEGNDNFSSNGVLVLDDLAGGIGADFLYGIAADVDERILVTGRAQGSNSSDMILLRYFADGTRDWDFGNSGLVLYDAGFGSNSYDIGYSVVFDGTGRILVAGSRRNESGDNDMALWCFDSDGNPDLNFGDEGLVFDGRAAGSYEQGYDLIIDEEGRIIVCGSVRLSGSTDDLALWRYDADGSPDPDFGTEGFAYYNGPANNKDYGYGLALDDSGRILVCGYSSNGSDYDMLLCRYTTDGSPDTTFSGDGALTHGNAAGGSGSDLAAAVVIDGAGRIVVAGYSMGQYDYKGILWAYTESGSLYSGFGTGGIASHSSSITSYFEDIALDAGGGFIVAGSWGASGGSMDSSLWRFDPSGNSDLNFGSSGQTVINAAGGTVLKDDGSKGLVLDGYGRPFTAGYLRSGTSDWDILICAYH